MTVEFTYTDGGVTAPKGFKAAGVKARIKYDKKDLGVIFSVTPAAAAGVFTTNSVKAAPVTLSMANLSDGTAQALVVNSGCANACTGDGGMNDARKMAAQTAQELGIDPSSVIVASTGVIGQELPMERIITGITEAAGELSETGGHDVALAIMTTDTVPKEAAVQFELDGKLVTVGGTAKGSGMIHPNMATMLSFVTSDVNIEPVLLKKALGYAVNRSFNMITVDGDTSTNDSLIVMANGMAGNGRITQEDENFFNFCEALTEVCVSLAKMIAKDGEGATKLVEIMVRKAASSEDARKVAMAVANSNLVKTAIFGEDANWGRIICAVGYSGVEIDPEKIDIYLGDEKMAEDGAGLRFSEEKAKEILSQDTIAIIIDLHMGEAEATAWTCDFSYDYVKINADYRT
ncbi:MAG TPA: bifunctional glutamate N-acetyltransferase/amino-acid acetyltransferase ArgJ [Desulfobacteria bacterium]|nr:bifunctional glutamate N-acetyltransferase/amino-acid acetyltransferase ArgJ [Desulfobacteria bacterium]